MEVFVFDWWWASHQSPAHSRSTYSQILCYALGKMNENPQSNMSFEDRLTWLKNSQEYRALDRIDGEPMVFEWKHFHRIQHVAAQPQSPRVTVKIHRNGLSSCRCSTTSHGDQKTTRKNASQMLNSFLLLQKVSEKDNGHSSDLDRRKSGILSVKTVHKVNGAKWLRRWWWHSQKADTSLPSHETIVQRSAQKQRRWKIVDTLLCRPGNDQNCFSHNYFCKSAQSLRSNRRNVWRKNECYHDRTGETRCERTIEFLVCAKCDQDKHACEWWSCT